MTPTYKSEAEIEAVVRGFENCTTDKQAFTHREHLTVAVWYIRHSPEHALPNMRNGLIRFLSHHQIDQGKYKEDVTVAWLDLTKMTLAELQPGISLLDATNAVVERLMKANLGTESRER